MTVIATNTVRPHTGKAKLQVNNMLEVTKAFGIWELPLGYLELFLVKMPDA